MDNLSVDEGTTCRWMMGHPIGCILDSGYIDRTTCRWMMGHPIGCVLDSGYIDRTTCRGVVGDIDRMRGCGGYLLDTLIRFNATQYPSGIEVTLSRIIVRY